MTGTCAAVDWGSGGGRLPTLQREERVARGLSDEMEAEGRGAGTGEALWGGEEREKEVEAT